MKLLFFFKLSVIPNYHVDIFFLIGIHPMQGWKATKRHGVTRKKKHKKDYIQDTENLFTENLQLKDVC